MVLSDRDIKLALKSGKLNGMVHFEPNSLATFYYYLKRNTRKPVVFIPTATFGGRELLNPDTQSLRAQTALHALLWPTPPSTEVRVGMPVLSDGSDIAAILANHDRDGLNAYFEAKVASLLPPQERGVMA